MFKKYERLVTLVLLQNNIGRIISCLVKHFKINISIETSNRLYSCIYFKIILERLFTSQQR